MMLVVSSWRSEEPMQIEPFSDPASSSELDTVCVIWGAALEGCRPRIRTKLLRQGCELNGTKKTALFEVENDLLEHQFFIYTICLSAESSNEMHVVEVKDSIANRSHPVPIATLSPTCVPMVSFSGFELVPPVTFMLRSGQGPVFIMGQHITFNEDVTE